MAKIDFARVCVLAITTTDVTLSRALDDYSGTNVYQNTTGKPLIVYATVIVGVTPAEQECGVTAYIDPNSPPTTFGLDALYLNAAATTNMTLPIFFIVPPNWYYSICIDFTSAGNPTLAGWIEQTLEC